MGYIPGGMDDDVWPYVFDQPLRFFLPQQVNRMGGDARAFGRCAARRYMHIIAPRGQ
jgi:hypothetical protein